MCWTGAPRHRTFPRVSGVQHVWNITSAHAVAAVLLLSAACGPAADSRSPLPPLKPAPPILVVTHADAGLVSLIDTTTRQVAHTIRVGARITAAALLGSGDRLYVSVPDAVLQLNLRERRVERTLRIPGEHDGVIVLGNRLYVVQNTSSKGKVTAIDLSTERVEAEREIDDLAGRPELSADGRRLYLPHSFYSGRVTILDAARLSVLATLAFEDRTTRVRLSPDERTLLVPNGSTSSGRVTLVDTVERRKVVDIPLDDQPTDIAVTLDGKRAIVPLFGASQIAIFDVDARTRVRTIAVETYPIRLELSPDGRVAYVLRNATNRLQVVDLETSAVTVLELEAEADDILAPHASGRR